VSLAIGDRAPEYELPDTEGRVWSLTVNGERPPRDGVEADASAIVTVIVFTCNHCPYALAWHDRIADAARDYAPRGVRFLAINSNDAVRYPHDSYEMMRRRVAGEDWPMPYLHDATQEVARAYGAKTTPDLFVLDRDGVVRYRGAPDADYDDPGLSAAWLRDALDAVLAGERPQRAQTVPVGCSIKWKP
jgi:peroxiredoxin